MAGFAVLLLCLCMCSVSGNFPVGSQARQFCDSSNNVNVGCRVREFSEMGGARGSSNDARGARRLLEEEEGHRDILALLDFKKKCISDDPNGVLVGWNASDRQPCNWRGVSCVRIRGTSRVHKLHLAATNLTGLLGSDIGKLAYLVYLNFSFNVFTGSISPGIMKLRHLTILDLSYNQLEGGIPSELGNLKNLSVIKLANNLLNGSIPSEIGQLQDLRNLLLQENRLTGSIPSEVGYLKELLYLNLTSNQLSGRIPKELGVLRKLEFLGLSANQLSGTIPSQVGKLRRLQQLSLFSNNLTGAIPPEMEQLASLRAFLANNNNLNGTIVPELGHLKSLQNLNLGNNSFSGELPPQLGMLEKLEVLDLSINKIRGNIPWLVANLTRLTYLDLSSNRFSGAVPPFLANCSMLRYLKLDNNSLIGEFPAEIGKLRHLHSLSVSRNKLSRVDPSLAFANGSSLVLINFCVNHLTGALPESWGQNRNLRVLAVGYNHLEGPLPAWLWSLAKLQLLDVSNNKFTGQIPPDISRFYALRKANIDKMSQPETLWQDSLVLNFKGAELFYKYFFSTQAFMDLSGNKLVGPIPSQLGSLISLRNLNLSNNKLTGQITPGLGNLSMLESLDLSSNHLQGQIPHDLTRLTSLVILNVSYNNLSGPIPQGAQFNTFQNFSYLGNANLCGIPLSKSCNSTGEQLGGNASTSSTNERRGRYKPSRVAIIMAVLVGTIFLGMALWFLAYKYYMRSDRSHDTIPFYCFEEGLKLRMSDLLDATNAYSDACIVGSGALSKVYKGVLGNGLVVAIKKLETASQDDAVQVRDSFVTECETLGKIRHRNLVKILAAFSDSTTKALVLSFMPNGSLEKQLHEYGGRQLNWETRYKIALGIAQAISYLHNETGTEQIIHCDLKPSNVLLDQEMEAHVSDFGIARMIDPHVRGAALSSTFRGSIGYIAPECAYAERICAKADVYSYGVLLLEMVTRRSPTSGPFPGGSCSLVEWVTKTMTIGEGKEAEVVDPSLLEDRHQDADEACTFQEIISLLRVGLVCCRNDPKERPESSVVLKMVKHIRTRNPHVNATMDTIVRYAQGEISERMVASTIDTSNSSY